jgi:hypothetical protein
MARMSAELEWRGGFKGYFIGKLTYLSHRLDVVRRERA